MTCPSCGRANTARTTVCDVCGNGVGLKLKYDVEECQERGMTYAVPLKVTIRLVVWNKDPDSGVKTIRDIKEQEVYFGDIPLMTGNGTFIINGTERVIVSQLHRSPGAFFHSEDKASFVAQIIPYRGSWVEFEYDAKNLVYVRIDRKRKFLATVFLRALGLRTAEEIIRAFHTVERVETTASSVEWAVSDRLFGRRVARTVEIPDSEVTIQAGKKVTRVALQALRSAGVPSIALADAELDGAFAVADVVDPTSGEVVVEANEEVTPRIVSMLQESDIDAIDVFFPEQDEVGPVLSATLKKDPILTHEDALIEIYRRLRPGDPPTLDSSRSLFENMFFNAQKYDFSRVGRLKLNTKLGLDTPLDERVLHPQDFYEVIKYLLKLRATPTNVDDIDHLGNRRVRSVGGAAREPVPDRARADGAGHQGEDVGLPGNGDRHAARPDQRQAGDGGHPGVLRFVPVVAVHGPDEPVVRGHPQAAALGPRSRRVVARAGRIRGARRPPDPLRPHLPDRDPGRPEHRTHLVPVVLRPDQRVRLHRVAVPEGQGRAGRRLRASDEQPAARGTRSVRWSRRTTRRRTTSPPRAARSARPSMSRTPSISRRGRRTST